MFVPLIFCYQHRGKQESKISLAEIENCLRFGTFKVDGNMRKKGNYIKSIVFDHLIHDDISKPQTNRYQLFKLELCKTQIY